MDSADEIEIKIEYNDIPEEDPLCSSSPGDLNHDYYGAEGAANEDHDIQNFSKQETADENNAPPTISDLSGYSDIKSIETSQYSMNRTPETINSLFIDKKESENKMDYNQQFAQKFYTENKAWSLSNSNKKQYFQENAVTWYKEIDGDGKLHCKFCNLSYSIVQTLRYHVRMKHPKEAGILKEAIFKSTRCQKLTCHICITRYSSTEELRDHVMEQHSFIKKGRFQCNHCSGMFCVKGELESHIVQMHLRKQKHWKKDNKQSASNTERDRQFQCPHCSHVAKRKYGLRTHIKAKHTSENDLVYVCLFCPYKASIKYYLQNHIATKHPQSDYAVSKVCHFCDVCGYKTPRKSHFVVHRKSHFATEKKHKCDVCDYATNLLSNLDVHRRTHTKEKPFICHMDGCVYRCSAKTALNSHMLKHNPDKYALYCDKCNYRTVYRHALKKHRESHDRKMSNSSKVT